MAQTFLKLLQTIRDQDDANTTTSAVTGIPSGTPQSQSRSMAWLLNMIRTTRAKTFEVVANTKIDIPSPADLLQTIGGERGPTGKPLVKVNAKMMIGDMMMFQYDAKHKDTLPYWDMFPVIFIIDISASSFLGINLHYLPPPWRATLMDALYTIISDPSLKDKAKLNISYDILKGHIQFKAFKPCVKRYLYDHIQSQRIRVLPSEWEIILTLPLAHFMKRDQLFVWSESVKKIISSPK